MQKGNIGVTTENIFPIIKKFLYSDHEIFLRELVSNAVDATQKLKTYASKGDFKGEMGDLTVTYTDEQFYWMREPLSIDLKQGDNEIKLYIPKTFRGQRWSFGFLKVTE